jgi:hypothetical protein
MKLEPYSRRIQGRVARTPLVNEAEDERDVPDTEQ